MLDRRTLLKLIATGTAFTFIPSSLILAKTKGKRYAMVIDVRKCTGCLSCTVNCTIENCTLPGVFRTEVSQFTIEGEGGASVVSLPHQCNHCDKPSCVTVCPVKATYKRPEDGIVVIDYDKCIHCMACTKACGYGARKPDPTHKNPPEKCNFCIHRVEAGLLPACVESCIGGARFFGDLNDPESEVYQLIKSNKTAVLLNEQGTGPNIYYIGLPEPFEAQKALKVLSTDWQR
ncbi:4Fe-4S dicluster domain-containing protein [uncultured Turicimonas sp.]|uniref:4Fe-4S dicluster domain-containing protein n=1 Tax=uncultured Turicimonas sp. TaxID=1918607 RepID=UPI003211C5B6